MPKLLAVIALFTIHAVAPAMALAWEWQKEWFVPWGLKSGLLYVTAILVNVTLVTLIMILIIRAFGWLLRLPGDRGRLEPKQRRTIVISAALGSTVGSLFLAAVIYFLSLTLSEALIEVGAIVLVALVLVAFLEPLFGRLREGLGITGSHHENPIRQPRVLLTMTFAILMLNGVLHTLLHEFIKENLEFSYVLLLFGPMATMIVTYCWMLGWHPDPAQSRAARRGAVVGAFFGLGMASSWVPHLTGAGKIVVPLLGFLLMTAVPFVGGVAMDRAWGWGMGWESRPSLSVTAGMIVTWCVIGGAYWLWVFAFEERLLQAFVTLEAPLPAHALATLQLHGWANPETMGSRSFLVLSGPIGLLGWGLGLFVSSCFDSMLTERRLLNTSGSDASIQERERSDSAL